jgi:hypothetical protein
MRSVTLQPSASVPSSRQSKKGHALEPVSPHTDRGARHRHERRTTRQRLLRHLRLIASGNRELRRPRPVSAPISPASPWGRFAAAESSNGSVTFARTPHLPAWSPPPCHHAAPRRIARLGDPARDRWLRLCRDFRHNRELADRKGPAIRARTGLLDLYGRHVPSSCAGPAFDSSSGYQGGGIVQCDRRLFAVALIMVTAARAEPPRVSAEAALPYGVLARAAPIAVTGCALSGLVGGAFYALVPAWMQDQDTPRATIALFMLVAVLGGFAFQIPVGRLSDRFDRRIVLAFSVSALPALPCMVPCRAPCRRSCQPRSCSADSCQHSTPSASPTPTIACRPIGSWR